MQMSHAQSRRQILTLMATAPILMLPGCASMGGWSLTDAIRELLTLSSQRAITSLAQPGGFYDSQIARIDLPNQIGASSNMLTRLLTSTVAKDRLTREINSAASRGAERAAPVLADSIRSISITDAAAILRGGPTAATSFLQRSMGNSLIGVMFPAVEDALSIANNPIVAEALRVASGINVASLAQDVAQKANDSIFRAIGVEETAIRANPESTRNPMLIGALKLGG